MTEMYVHPLTFAFFLYSKYPSKYNIKCDPAICDSWVWNDMCTSLAASNLTEVACRLYLSMDLAP